ncbi:MAG: hypothetical protein IGS49_00130 [Chlorogloeopsis fritschii C42_A2020_084]|uniref:hypothetical protein n=1 Tax=Chlorogloeopsis fritschii TaxID=1124 RepID=UPI001A014EF7|nr:hypothetical protein [Chlorogloeopsis fritschii]MBF2003908.1 hypothetical protein [Chlorogloeopsis fritschii C42_A2020_084]
MNFKYLNHHARYRGTSTHFLARVLQQFLQRHRIYFTDLMFANFESSARHNLKAEIQFIEQIS